jgi:hypothetical protein
MKPNRTDKTTTQHPPGGDRGGVGDLVATIKSSKVPIICICNDKYSQKLKPLKAHVLELDFRCACPPLLLQLAPTPLPLNNPLAAATPIAALKSPPFSHHPRTITVTPTPLRQAPPRRSGREAHAAGRLARGPGGAGDGDEGARGAGQPGPAAGAGAAADAAAADVGHQVRARGVVLLSTKLDRLYHQTETSQPTNQITNHHSSRATPPPTHNTTHATRTTQHHLHAPHPPPKKQRYDDVKGSAASGAAKDADVSPFEAAKRLLEPGTRGSLADMVGGLTACGLLGDADWDVLVALLGLVSVVHCQQLVESIHQPARPTQPNPTQPTPQTD